MPALLLAPSIKLIKHPLNEPNAIEYKVDKKLKDFTQLGSFAAANEGPYHVTGYRHNHCDGTIAIMPLHRNAEGAAILNRLLGERNVRSGVILEGRIYPYFPQMTYTLVQIKHNFKKLLQYPPHQQLPLLAFAESGGCKLAEKIMTVSL